MPRSTTPTLLSLLPACKTQSLVKIKLRDEVDPYFFCTNEPLTVDGDDYLTGLLRVGELKETQNTATNRIQIKLSNVDLVFGIKLASDLRKLELADITVKRYYQSLTNPATIETAFFFLGKLIGAQANEREIDFDVIPDTTAAGTCIAQENLSPSNGWVFPESPTTSPPGTGSNPGGGIGHGSCFSLDTLICTPGGDIPIGELKAGMPIVSFNHQTGEIYRDEVEEVFEDKVRGIFTLEFEHGTVRVTPRHRFFTGDNCFKQAAVFSLKQTVQVYSKGWVDSRLIGMKWDGLTETEVRNFRVKNNRTYFANGFAVHNSKLPEEP